MPLQLDTVAIPVTKGIDVNTSARLVEPPYLLEAKNTTFAFGNAAKRYGHVANVARSGTYPVYTRPVLDPPQLTPYGAKILDSNWLFGWGYINNEQRPTDDTFLETSEYPEAGYLFGAGNRDSEVFAWSGHSLFSQAPGQEINQARIDSAVMPALRTSPIAKSNIHQFTPDVVDNGIIRVCAWLDVNSSESGFYNVYDSVTGAPLVIEGQLTVINTPSNLRIFCMGNYVHILILTIASTNLKLYTINSQSPSTIVTRSLGEAIFFDVWKVDETATVVAKVTAAGAITTEWIATSGIAHPEILGVTPNIGNNVAIDCAIAVHPTQPAFALVYNCATASVSNPDKFVGVVCNFDGTQKAVQFNIRSIAAGEVGEYHAITVAPRYLLDTRGVIQFITFATFFPGTTGFTTTEANTIIASIFDETGVYATKTKYHLRVASQAVRCGDRCFVWAGYASNLQGVWLLLDEQLDPVGHLSFGNADTKNPAGLIVDVGRNQYIRSMNWRLYPNQITKDVLVFNIALAYKNRVEVTDENTGLYTEPVILFTEVDFLPQLRSAQAGRTTYFSGAQVWAYDGNELMEHNFHICPEPVLTQSTTGGPGLTLLGTYSYRVDLCYRNAQNEEIRSHSILKQVTLTGTNNTITLDIPTCITRRTNAYILISRNSMQSGSPTTAWNLLNSRDPTAANYKINDQTNARVTFVDDGTITDAAILATELHPMNVSNYLQPFAGPACEIIAAGRERLWVAGGELGPGQLGPSRLFEPGEVPAFHPNLYRQVDRSNDSVTAIGFVGDIAIAFRRNQTYVLEGDGPDNTANGYWSPARLAYSDVGAVSQESLGLITLGLCFQSLGGFRLINPGGGLINIGEQVDPEAVVFTCSGTLVVGEDHEVRFYGPEQVFVYNYEAESWSTWTCKARGVAKQTNGRAVIVYGSNFLTETVDYYKDNVSNYEHRLQFPWLHGGNLGDFQRIRRFAGFGSFDPEQPHNIRVAIYYDERDFPEEWWDWTIPDTSQNEDAWGNATWGAGVWGDTSSVSGSLEDSVWRWRRRPRRQKCSVFSISVSDRSSDGPGFNMSVLALEIGRKQGLDRIPAVTGGSSVNRG